MKIRKYTGKDAQEAMLKAKIDLGSNAVILKTYKAKKKGLFGMFKKPLTEVLAAVDENIDKKAPKVSRQYNSQEKTNPLNHTQTDTQSFTKSSYPISKAGNYTKYNGLNQKSVDNDYNTSQPIIKEDKKIKQLENKVNSMEEILQKIYTKIDGKGENNNQDVEIKQNLNNKDNKENDQNPEKNHTIETSSIFENFQNKLVEHDVEPQLAKKIVEKAFQNAKNKADVDEIYELIKKIIVGVLGSPSPINIKEDGTPTVVMLIGPTGVGKTTTLAKLAADYSLNKGKSIGLITADTYRIAAVEQLKTYAGILNMDVEVIYSVEEINTAKEKYYDKDLILIDTAGRSYKNTIQFNELKSLVAAAKADEIYLVLSAETGKRSCREILKNYNFMSDYKLLFTKLDEACVNGIILNARYATNKNLSYTTSGQSVPDDFEVADVNKIAKNILGSLK